MAWPLSRRGGEGALYNESHIHHPLLTSMPDLGRCSSFRACKPILAGFVLGAMLSLQGVHAARSDSVQAARYHEDALARLARNDVPGAIIQARNAVQQDKSLLAAHVLLGKALLRDGQAAAAEAEFEVALNLGASMTELAQPYGTALMMFGNSEKLLARIKPDGLGASARAEVLAMRAAAHADQGNMKAAWLAIDEGKVADPRSLAPLRAEIDLALRTRDTPRARKALDAAVAMAPRDAQLLHLQGVLNQGAGKVAAALDFFAQALKADPRLLDAMVARASLLIDLQRPDEAMPDLERAAALSQREPRVAYLKSLVFAARGDARSSRAQLEEVTRLVDALPDTFIARQPPLLMLGALASQATGRLERARALLELYVLRMPDDPAGRKLLAGIYLSAGETARVADLLDPLLRSGDADPQVLTTLAALRMQQRRYRDAAEALERAARLTSGDPGITAQMGFARLAGLQGDLGLAALRNAFDKEPGQFKVAAALATLYLRRNDVPNATAVAEALVRRLPADAAAHNLLGAIKAATQRPAEARSAYLKALALQPGLMPARLNLARLDVAEGRLAEARQRLAALLKEAPDNGQVLTEMARLENHAGRPAAALPLLEKVQARMPGDVASGLELLEAYRRLGQPGAALALAKELVRVRPDDPVVLESLGRAHMAAGEGVQARAAFASLARMAGPDPGNLVAIGQLQLSAGAANDAGASAEKALAAKPGYLPAQVLQVEAEILAGNLPRAEVLQRQLAARGAGGADALRLAGDLAMARQHAGEAARHYQAAFDRAPSTALALRSFNAAFQAGEGARGVALLEAWLRRQPDVLTVQAALAEGYLRLGRLEQARSTYAALLARDPQNAGATNNLAQVLMRLNDPGALAMAEKAARLAPTDANALDTLGWLQARSGALALGLKTLREARLRAPDSREVRYHLAWVLHRSGKRDEARDELAAVFRSQGDFESQAEAQTLRRELGV